ncbi:MAG TPA: CIA30 family protein [Hyphomicrobiaceae bacterium]|nr:CIA30 family protein [Hyphomicrobiaceae bacterium]
MHAIITLTVLAVLVLCTPSAATAEDILIDDFELQPETRWRFIADTVMGGVSAGQVEFVREDGDTYAHMTGSVSTENNGGFIQFRMELSTLPPKGTVGLRLVARGNDQRYFVHLRTSGTVLPWQYYQAGFDVAQEWAEVRLPFEDFKASGWLLRTVPEAKSLKSVGVVAFGRDHEADIDVREISFY